MREYDDGAHLDFPTGTDPSVVTQRLMIGDMVGKSGKACMRDPDTGAWMTYGQVFDHHARLLLVIEEVEARAREREKVG